jgi:hypothetical protein
MTNPEMTSAATAPEGDCIIEHTGNNTLSQEEPAIEDPPRHAQHNAPTPEQWQDYLWEITQAAEIEAATTPEEDASGLTTSISSTAARRYRRQRAATRAAMEPMEPGSAPPTPRLEAPNVTETPPPLLDMLESVSITGEVQAGQPSSHYLLGVLFCPGGHSYALTPSADTVEWRTFVFHSITDNLRASASIVELRIRTTARVHEIRQLLAELHLDTGMKQPFMLRPGTMEILPCLLSARQVRALARGVDATSTPVDTIIHIKDDTSKMVQPPAKDWCCESCRQVCPASEWNGSQCHRGRNIQPRAVKPEPQQPAPVWQI